jgi:hypothetical protein
MVPHLGKPKGSFLPSYQLNLDLAPEERWVDIAKDFYIPLQQILAFFDWILPSVLDPFFDLLGFWAENIFHYPEMI